jgi:hypothetical protein
MDNPVKQGEGNFSLRGVIPQRTPGVVIRVSTLERAVAILSELWRRRLSKTLAKAMPEAHDRRDLLIP